MVKPPAFGNLSQVRATKTLLKFCRDHHHTPFFIGKLEECVAALEKKDKESVFAIVELLSRADIGSYLDWYPDVINENEDPDYVESVWWSLDSSWKSAMRMCE
jgi:hypothetical protein